VTDIIELLRARLNGDLQWSIETTTHRERENEPAYPVAMVNPVFIDTYTPDGMTFDVADCQHAARWDPARVLAEIAFKRDLLVWCERSLFDDDGRPSIDDGWNSSMYAARDFLRSMATLYKSHPDYNPAWALDTI
jgi:hypothetical protein